MKKLQILPVLFFLASFMVKGQTAGDAAIVAAVSIGHYVENQNLIKIRDNEVVIMGLQETIAIESEAIRELNERLMNSLETVQAFINDAQTIREITLAGEDIANFQVRIAEIVADDPELVIIALSAEAYLVEQSYNILLEIAVPVLGGDVNLMNNKERMDLLHRILLRMTDLRTMTYELMRRLELAEGVEILENIEDVIGLDMGIDWEVLDQERRNAINTFIRG